MATQQSWEYATNIFHVHLARGKWTHGETFIAGGSAAEHDSLNAEAFKAEEWLREFVRPKCLEQGSNSEEFVRAISTVLLILSGCEWNGMYA